MSRVGHASEPDLASAVRRAASEAQSGSVVGSRLPSHVSRRSSRHSSSYISGSSGGRSRKSEKGFTLEQQQAAVGNMAMDKYITALQAEAQVAVKESEGWKRKMQGDKDEEQNEIRRKKEISARNCHLLQSQIEENKMRRAEDRREWIEAASTHSFPLFGETFISVDEVTAYRKQQKVDFKKELTAQLEVINTMKNLEKREHLDHAHEKAYENTKQMVKDRKAERDRRGDIGRLQVASWDRDLRLMHIKKAILSGKDVVRQTLGPGDMSSSSGLKQH